MDFERDGAAADYAIANAGLLAAKPRTVGYVESAAVPLPALSAWQALFDHGRLAAGERVLIHGARQRVEVRLVVDVEAVVLDRRGELGGLEEVVRAGAGEDGDAVRFGA